MLEICCQENYSLLLLEGKTIAVTGHGSQGHACALNLKESGCNVIVGLYEGSRSWERAEEQGFEVYTVAEATRKTGAIMILISGEKQVTMYKESIAPNLHPDMVPMFAHDFAIHFGQIVPPEDVDVTTITPRASGHAVRSEYRRGRETPCLIVVYQDATGKITDMALAYDQRINGARADVPETTFKIETETNLFGEQAVLYNGVCALMKAGFEALVEVGYTPENAYLKCVHETRLIVDPIYEGGFADVGYLISNVAEYGDYIIGPRVMIDKTEETMKKTLSGIQDGTSAKGWLTENRVGCPHFSAIRKNEAAQPLKKVGSELRKLYSWNDIDKLINN